MSTGLDGHVVLVTGSSRGIGAAAARALARDGARVVLHGRAPSAELEAMSAELDAPFVTADVADGSAVNAAVDQILEEHGQIHALVANAGTSIARPFAELSDDDWLEEIKVNVLGVFHACQAVAPSMIEHGYGRMVLTSSIRGQSVTASARGMAYSASKAAVSNLASTLAKELAPTINVSAVAPGFVRTEMAAGWSEKVWDQVRSSLVGRIGEPEEIAEAIAFLASERSSFATGQTIVVDGGYTISGK